jgi:hypothetical protein
MATTADAGAEIERDRMERLADMYSEKMAQAVADLITAAQAFAESLDYSEFLRMNTEFERIRDAMHNRTAMRVHSDSFNARHPKNTADAALSVR